MAGFDRYDNILKLFIHQRSSWTAIDIAHELGGAQSTVYRTVRELVAAGFLESTIEAHYRLGPAFLEFEYSMRASDPLVRSGAIFLETLVEQAGVSCSAVLARLYGNRVMCVADAHSSDVTQETSFKRGRPMPILLSATSKAILAGLPGRRREQLFDAVGPKNPEERQSLTEELKNIKKRGISITSGELDKGAVGLASLVRNQSLGINASLSLILATKDYDESIKPRLLSLLTSNAKLIENFMEDAHKGMLQP